MLPRFPRFGSFPVIPVWQALAAACQWRRSLWSAYGACAPVSGRVSPPLSADVATGRRRVLILMSRATVWLWPDCQDFFLSLAPLDPCGDLGSRGYPGRRLKISQPAASWQGRQGCGLRHTVPRPAIHHRTARFPVAAGFVNRGDCRWREPKRRLLQSRLLAGLAELGRALFAGCRFTVHR